MDSSKRTFLKRSIAFITASGLIARGAKDAPAAGPPDIPPWMTSPGAGFNECGVPSKHESKVARTYNADLLRELGVLPV